MITLTEKRLQELENRIPVYEAMIAELKQKLDEVNTFPKELAEMKAWIKKHLESSNGLLTRISDVHDEKNQQHNTLLLRTADHDKSIQSLVGSCDALRSISNLNAESITTIQNNVNKLLSFMHDLIERLESVEKTIRFHEGCQSTIVQRLDKLDRDSIDHSIKNQVIADVINGINENLTRLSASCAQMATQYNEELAKLKQTIPEKPKSYDGELAEIRKDIAVILSVMHTTTSQPTIAPEPQKPQVDDKIKSLEQAIAQIYTLLKKYEPR